jgi:gp16 family phage-associated protein
MSTTLKSSVAAHPHTKQILERFRAAGLTVTEWAKANGFRRDTAYKVIHGSVQAYRGESHAIAVALGLKPQVEKADPRSFKPLRARQ